MTWNGELPHTWTEFAGLVIVGLVVMILAQIAGGALLFRYHRGNAKTIKDQVVNGHATTLRKDVDVLGEDVGAALKAIGEMKAEMKAAMQTLGEELRLLRDELADERRHRHSLGRELRQEFDDEVADLRKHLPHRRNGGA